MSRVERRLQKKDLERNANFVETPLPLRVRLKSLCTESFLQQLLYLANGVESKTGNIPRSKQEDVCLALTSCIVHALHERGKTATVQQAYWVDLQQQIEVDQWVEFAQYCAAKRFHPLKAKHLLEWLLSFQLLIEQRPVIRAESEGEKKECAEHTIQKAHSPFGSATLPLYGEEAPVALTSNPELCFGVELPANSEESPLTFEEQLQKHINDFVASEIELCWKWERRHYPQDSFALLPPGVLASAGFHPTAFAKEDTAAAAGAQPSTISSSGTASIKKKTKSEKQNRQQQEQLEEEQRLSAAAIAEVFPSENIYLTSDDVPSFVDFFLYQGLLNHAALYQYVCHYPQAEEGPGNEKKTTATPDIVVAVEKPFLLPPMHLAVSTAQTASMNTIDTLLLSAPTSEANQRGLRSNSNTVAKSFGGSTARGSNTETTSVAERDTVVACEDASIATPLVTLHAQQQKEISQLIQENKERIIAEELHAVKEQLEKEMTLFFDCQKTQNIVEAVYTSIADAVQERQWRILQRVDALEAALGLNSPSHEGTRTPLQENKSLPNVKALGKGRPFPKK